MHTAHTNVSKQKHTYVPFPLQIQQHGITNVIERTLSIPILAYNAVIQVINVNCGTLMQDFLPSTVCSANNDKNFEEWLKISEREH